MKRLFFYLLCILCIFFSPNFILVDAKADAFIYAQIKENARLFDEQKREICSLPSTYFVMVTGESVGDFLPVYYDGLEGFVKSESIQIVDYEPKYKYAKISLTFTNDGHKINLRDRPSHTDGEVIAEVDSGEVAKYFGATNGSIQIAAVGNKWYYCKIEKKGESVVGYVYSLYALVDEIPPNVIEKIESSPSQITQTEDFSSSSPSPLQEVVIILSLCLPVLVGIYLIFRK